jgi:hypothetical protein
MTPLLTLDGGGSQSWKIPAARDLASEFLRCGGVLRKGCKVSDFVGIDG